MRLHHIDRAFSQPILQQLTLIQILRLAILFTQGRLQPRAPQVKVNHLNNTLVITLTEQFELQAKLKKEVESKLALA